MIRHPREWFEHPLYTLKTPNIEIIDLIDNGLCT